MAKAVESGFIDRVKRPELKLKTILSISFALLGIFTAGMMVLVMYHIARVQIYQEVRQSLRDVAAVSALQIDGDIHKTLIEPQQEGSSEYTSIRKVLQSIQNAGSDIFNVYTIRYTDGNLRFIVDATSGEYHSNLGDIYEDATPGMIKNLSQINEPTVGQEFTSNLWGVTLSGYAPIYTSNGSVDGFLGIDTDASKILVMERNTVKVVLVIFTLLVPVMVLFGWILGSRLADPFSTLLYGITRISKGELDHRIKVNTRTEIGKLASEINHMTDRFNELLHEKEDNAAQHTRNLEKHTRNLEATTTIHQVLCANLDPKNLADGVVNELQGLFHLCFVGLYRLNKQQDVLCLYSASGDAGSIMLEHGSKFLFGEGMVGWAAAYEKSRIALKVEEDPLWENVDELPDVKSAVVFPLRSRGQILGALCLYSQDAETFDDDNLPFLQNLAEQVGMGLDNAILFTSSQNALEDSRKTFSSLSRSAWAELLQGRTTSGYRSSENGVEEIPLDSKHESGLDQRFLEIPVIIRDQALATIRAAKPDGSNWWSDEEIRLMRTLAEQLSIALENARLFTDTQFSAERERILSEISGRVRASTNLDVILRTAVQDLAEILQVNKASIQLRTQDDKGSSRRSDAW